MSAQLNRARWLCSLLCLATAAFGQNHNGYQTFQYFRGNYSARSGSVPLPIFKVDFSTGSITPLVGTGGTFARASARIYGTSLTAVSSVSSGNVALGAYPNHSRDTSVPTKSGIYFGGLETNYVIQSRDITTTWTKINGAETLTANSTDVTDIIGGTNADKIVTTAGTQGVTERTGASAPSGTHWHTFSAFMRTLSGTLAVKLRIVGALTTWTSDTFTVDSTWRQYYVTGEMVVGDTTMDVQIEAQAAGTFYVDGMQLENREDTTDFKEPGSLINTTTVPVSYQLDDLNYPSSNISSAFMAKGSAVGWLLVRGSPNTFTAASPSDRNLFAIGTANSNIAFDVFYPGRMFRGIYNNTETVPGSWGDWKQDRYMHEVFSWDNTTTPGTFTMYQNGMFVQSVSATRTTPAVATIQIGKATSTSNKQGQTIVRNVEFYDRMLGQAQVSALYNRTKAEMGLPIVPTNNQIYGSSSESGVLDQWKFDEASGSLISENGIVSTAVGTVDYQIPAANYSDGAIGQFAGLGYGQYFDGTNDAFQTTTDQATLDLGSTNDLNIEVQMKMLEFLSGDGMIVDTYEATTGYHLYGSGTGLNLFLISTTGQNDTVSCTFDNRIDDGRIHHVRTTLKLTVGAGQGDFKCYVDGTLQADTDTLGAGLFGTIINSTGLAIGQRLFDASDKLRAVLYELRLSTDITLSSYVP